MNPHASTSNPPTSASYTTTGPFFEHEFGGVNLRYNVAKHPLHRAVQTGNRDLVALLLKHGIDPNGTNELGQTPLHLLFVRLISPYYFSTPGRFSDPVIAGMLLKAGADMTLDEDTLVKLFISASLNNNIWSLLGVLIAERNDAKKQLIERCRKKDAFNFLVMECGRPDSNGKYGYDILESCLKVGVEPHVLRHGLQLAIEFVVLNAVLLLIKTGADMDLDFAGHAGKMLTPFHFALNHVTTFMNIMPVKLHKSVARYPISDKDFQHIDSRFRVLWLIAKAGGRTMSSVVRFNLAHCKVTLRSVYDRFLLDRRYWPLQSHSAVQNHLRLWLDILNEIQPPTSLLDLCRIAVRQALWPGFEDKLKKLALPVPLRDCILPTDHLQAIVDGIAPTTSDSNPDFPHAISDVGSISPARFPGLPCTESLPKCSSEDTEMDYELQDEWEEWGEHYELEDEWEEWSDWKQIAVHRVVQIPKGLSIYDIPTQLIIFTRNCFFTTQIR